MKLPELKAAIAEEWRNTRHNASLLHYAGRWPEGVTWEEVMAYGDDALNNLEYELEHKFGKRIHVARIGRGGATVVPIDWIDEDGFNSSVTLVLANERDAHSESNVEYYNRLLFVYRVIRHINKFVEDWVDSIAHLTPGDFGRGEDMDLPQNIAYAREQEGLV